MSGIHLIDRPHGCPHCHCVWDLTDDPGTVNTDAPFYPLVEMVDAVAWRRTETMRERGRYSGSRKVVA